MIFPLFSYDFSVFLWFSHIFPIFPTIEWDDAPGTISPSHLGAKFQAPNLPRDTDWQAVTLDKGLMRHPKVA